MLPNRPVALSEGAPAARLYGDRMSAELARLMPDAPATLQIAARGQHIERWTSPRARYPEGKAAYLAWRRDLQAYHARRIRQIMAAEGWPEADIAATEAMIRKEGLKRDPLVQMLEDVACFTFLRWYFHPFAEGRDPGQLLKIVERTARKMSAPARARALAEFALPAPFDAAFRP